MSGERFDEAKHNEHTNAKLENSSFQQTTRHHGWQMDVRRKHHC